MAVIPDLRYKPVQFSFLWTPRNYCSARSAVSETYKMPTATNPTKEKDLLGDANDLTRIGPNS